MIIYILFSFILIIFMAILLWFIQSTFDDDVKIKKNDSEERFIDWELGLSSLASTQWTYPTYTSIGLAGSDQLRQRQHHNNSNHIVQHYNYNINNNKYTNDNFNNQLNNQTNSNLISNSNFVNYSPFGYPNYNDTNKIINQNNIPKSFSSDSYDINTNNVTINKPMINQIHYPSPIKPINKFVSINNNCIDVVNKSTINQIQYPSPINPINKVISKSNDCIDIVNDNRAPEKPIIGLIGSPPLITINRMNLLISNNPTENNISSKQIDSTESNKSPRPSQNSSSNMSNIQLLNLKDLALDKVIGGGGFGQVWLGHWCGTPVAVKILNLACQHNVPSHVLEEFESEVNILQRLRHPNICMFLGACLDPPNRAIVTELVSQGTLWELLRTPGLFEDKINKASRLGNITRRNSLGVSRSRSNSITNPITTQQFHWPMWVIRRVLDGTCRGLIYLHNQHIIHRDMKSANLLLDDSFNVKICDFGLARLKDYTIVMTANVGTVQWMSPEVLTGQPYTELTDIYSLAMIVWECLTGKCPFEGMTHVEAAISIVQRDNRPPIPPQCTSQQSQFLKTCWNTNPNLRLAALEALNELEKVFPLS